MDDKPKQIRQFHFALTDKDDPGLVAHMAGLAKQKQLTEEIKTAITLLAQLKAGNRELLDAMFPGICKPTTPPKDDNDLDRIADKVAERLESKWQQHPMSQDAGIPDGRAGGFPLMQPAPKGLGNYAIAMPMFDDDNDGETLVLSKSTAASVNGSNLLSGMMGL